MDENGYTVRRLASDLGVAKSTVQGWVNGEAPVTQRTALALITLGQMRAEA